MKKSVQDKIHTHDGNLSYFKGHLSTQAVSRQVEAKRGALMRIKVTDILLNRKRMKLKKVEMQCILFNHSMNGLSYIYQSAHSMRKGKNDE